MARSLYALGFTAVCIFACDSHPTSPKAAADNASLTRAPNAMVKRTSRDSKIVSFETMYGVAEAFVKHNQIRGVRGDELPWEVGSATGSLTVHGHLTASVRGSSSPTSPRCRRNCAASTTKVNSVLS